MNQAIPAVSVIIPMYNAEKFIGACLESILAQTFQDFEIIVADDCPTDNSCAIVESYLEKHGQDKIKLLRSKKNFGNPCVPRNRAMCLARGKYIQFVDSDDMLIPTTLEELYKLAEDNQADVVYSQQYFAFADENAVKRVLMPPNPVLAVDKITFETDDLAERVKIFVKGRYNIGPMQYFCRRDFLIENEIFFPEVLVSEDDFWIMHVICTVGKILLVPNTPLYLNRSNPNSLTLSKKSVEQIVRYHMTPTIAGMECMKDVLSRSEVLAQNPASWYSWVLRLANHCFRKIFDSCASLPAHEVYRIFKEQFAQELGEHTELVAYLCSMINNQQKQLYIANKKIAGLEKQLSATSK